MFCRIDHAANAVSAGLQLRPTEVLIFGNAKGGPPRRHGIEALGAAPATAMTHRSSPP